MCNFSGMIKNVLPSLRQRAGPQRICSRQKSIRSGTARDSFSQAPHMRGKVIVDLVLTERHRITPACAGKRWIMMKPGWRCRDHPRVCGEKIVQFVLSAEHAGSPPRMRGKVLCYSCVPATLEDHPRMCGEKDRLRRLRFQTVGSPPHVRGKVSLERVGGETVGITPACAGKRRFILNNQRSCKDHPRMCGEKTL